jgi:hypothetical protein
MMTAAEKALVARLPKAAAKPLRALLSRDDTSGGDAPELVQAAAAAVAFPELGEIFPLPEELTREQRVLAEIFAHRRINVGKMAMPTSAWNRRRWLGLDAGGVLEKRYRGEPLWRALKKARGVEWPRPNVDAQRKILDALPMPDRLAAYAEVALGAYRLSVFGDVFYQDLAKLKAEGKSWAPKFAGVLLGIYAETPSLRIPVEVKWLVFVALVRARVAIKPEWDILLPLLEGSLDLAIECVSAIPPERRLAAITEALRGGPPGWQVDMLLQLLPHFPDPALVPLVHEYIEFSARPKKKILAALDKIAKRTPALRASVAKEKPPAPSLVLKCRRVPAPKRLSSIEKKQLAPILAAEDNDAKGIRWYQLADDAGKLRYQAILARGEDGYVYQAGTTKRVASVVQGGVDVCKDRALADAIDEAFAELHDRRQ